MVESTRDIGEEILEGIRQLKRGEHGRIINVPAIASIREKTRLSQSRFAELGCICSHPAGMGAGLAKSSGAARTLLLIAEKNPPALIDVA